MLYLTSKLVNDQPKLNTLILQGGGGGAVIDISRLDIDILKKERMNFASCKMFHIDRSQEYTRPKKFLQKERSAICMQLCRRSSL